jgi:branched-chain amino acid aminotransferase
VLQCSIQTNTFDNVKICKVEHVLQREHDHLLQRRICKSRRSKGNLYDQSLHYGYAVFEGIRAYSTGKGTKIFKAKEHFERMEFSCKAVGIPYPFNNNELTDISYEVLKRNNLTNAYLRPLVSSTPNMALTAAKGSHLVIAAWEWGAYMGNNLLRLKTSSFRKISPNSIIVQAKVSGPLHQFYFSNTGSKEPGIR